MRAFSHEKLAAAVTATTAATAATAAAVQLNRKPGDETFLKLT